MNKSKQDQRSIIDLWERILKTLHHPSVILNQKLSGAPPGASPVLLPGHALLVDGSGQLLGVGEDVVVVEDHGLHHLVDVGLAGHLVQGVRSREQGGPEHDGQVSSVHHVLIAVLGQAGGRRTEGH